MSIRYYYRPHQKDGEGNIFTLCVNLHLDWGGGGYPIPGLDGGISHPRSGWWGYPPAQDWMGCPLWPGLDGVPPSQNCWMGYSP